MITEQRDRAPSPPVLARRPGLRLAPAGPLLWRVADREGRIVGHLEARTSENGTRYRARRFHAPTRAFRDLGDFWSADDAVDALRFA